MKVTKEYLPLNFLLSFNLDGKARLEITAQMVEAKDSGFHQVLISDPLTCRDIEQLDDETRTRIVERLLQITAVISRRSLRDLLE